MSYQLDLVSLTLVHLKTLLRLEIRLGSLNPNWMFV